jgi:hypothetical protein
MVESAAITIEARVMGDVPDSALFIGSYPSPVAHQASSRFMRRSCGTHQAITGWRPNQRWQRLAPYQQAAQSGPPWLLEKAMHIRKHVWPAIRKMSPMH